MIEKTKTGYKQTKLGWIPEDWEVKQLGQFGEFKNGINKSKEDFGHGVPFVNLMDVFGKPIVQELNLSLVNANENEVENYSLQKGDVLFVRSSVKPSGVGLTSLINVDIPNTVYSGFLIRFRQHETLLEHGFKRYCFYNTRFRNNLVRKSSSSANTNINQDSLQKLEICLPPLSEQQKIAQILSTWDKAIGKLEALIAQKQKRKKGLMQALLTGKKRFKEFNDNWIQKRIKDVLTIGSGKDYKHLNQGEIPVYGTGGLMTYVDEYLYNGTSVGIGRKGTIDKPLLLKGKFWTVDTLFYTHSFKEVVPEYIFYLFLTIPWKLYNEASGLPSLSKKTIEGIKVLIPPFKEQQKIATVLSVADDEINQLQTQLNQVKEQKKGLMQKLLTGEVRVRLNEKHE